MKNSLKSFTWFRRVKAQKGNVAFPKLVNLALCAAVVVVCGVPSFKGEELFEITSPLLETTEFQISSDHANSDFFKRFLENAASNKSSTCISLKEGNGENEGTLFVESIIDGKRSGFSVGNQ
jgi:hypothetical protein